MPRGKATKRDNIKTGDTKRPEETDALSAVDVGIDFVKANETAQIGHDSKS